jgi:hypothetical protein
LLIQPLSRFKGGAPVRLAEGILFCTYATLRNEPRLKQSVDWLGGTPGSETAFDGVIVFDEAHAMANAVGGKSERGEQLASQQGRAGLRLQRALPDARIVYVSATGATDVRNLAYAERLGLWGGADFPFANRAEFIEAVEAGGVAAMEILARDMKSLGLYAARSLSYEGVEIEIVEHELSPAQVEIYDAYAGAFQVIHRNLQEALKAVGITADSRTLNGQARSAALSVFESSKQRSQRQQAGWRSSARRTRSPLRPGGHRLSNSEAVLSRASLRRAAFAGRSTVAAAFREEHDRTSSLPAHFWSN